jgi:hypothetical protein
MPNEPTKPDKPITAQIEENIQGHDPVKAAAVAVDNPAETIVEAAEEVAEVEPVEEVIEAHAPQSNPVLEGINTLIEKVGGMEARMTALENRQQTQAKPEPKEPEPTQPKEVKENATQKATKRGLRFKSRK